MARTLLVLSLVATSGSLLVACTQDFNVFKPGQGGAGGNAATTTVSSSSSSSTGTGAQCTATDLSKCDDMNPCTIESCDATGTCKSSNAPDGLAPGYTDDPTDCVDDTCKAGVFKAMAPDDTEVPAAKDCNVPSCSAGMKVYTPDPTKNNMQCGAGPTTKCDNGVCKGCTMPIDCGTDTFCQSFACDANQQCSSTNLHEGMALPTGQTPNDCTQIVCAAGSTSNVADANDHPANGAPPCGGTFTCNGTTLNSSFPGGATTCGNGPSCPTMSSQKAQDTCNGSGSCAAGMTTNCTASFSCTSNACNTMCTTNAQCVTGKVCDTNSGSANINKCVECAANSDCSGATPACETTVPGSAKFDTCVACIDDSTCGGSKPKCKTTGVATQFTCVECLADPDCPPGKPTCTNNVCN